MLYFGFLNIGVAMNRRLTYAQAVQAAATLLANGKENVKRLENGDRADIVNELFELADHIFIFAEGSSDDEDLGF